MMFKGLYQEHTVLLLPPPLNSYKLLSGDHWIFKKHKCSARGPMETTTWWVCVMGNEWWVSRNFDMLFRTSCPAVERCKLMAKWLGYSIWMVFMSTVTPWLEVAALFWLVLQGSPTLPEWWEQPRGPAKNLQNMLHVYMPVKGSSSDCESCAMWGIHIERTET